MTKQLDYETLPPRRKAPRWLVIIIAALAGAGILFFTIAILTSPHPDVAVRDLILEHFSQGVEALLSIAAFFAVRGLGPQSGRRWSFLAVFALLLVVLNPAILEKVSLTMRLPTYISGGRQFRSFLTGLLALVVGIIAAVRIWRSRGALRGMPLAIAGAIGGVLWAVYWIYLYVSFVTAMAGWR